MPSRFSNDEPPVAAADARAVAGAAGCPSASDADTAAATPNWFADFLIDRATRKPSAHTLKAYRQDFTAVADLLTSGDPADVALIDITRDNMRAAFAAYASTRGRPVPPLPRRGTDAGAPDRESRPHVGCRSRRCGF